MDLSTTYVGLRLPHPLMAGASPLSGDADAARRLEEAGAAAIVMPSLFEEQIVGEELAAHWSIDGTADSHPEASSYFPSHDDVHLGPHEYLQHVERIRAATSIPVIASLNGTTRGGWLRYARLIAEAGAHALELNLYSLPLNPGQSGDEVERESLDLVRAVKSTIAIPVAVKLSPFYSSIAHFAGRLDALGADALVLFNRFYQPELDIETLEVGRTIHLSDPSELNLRIHWIAVLSGRVKASLAVTGGVHSGVDALKATMAGAHAVQLVSALLRGGLARLGEIRREMESWLAEHEYDSLAQLRGSLSLERCPNPRAYERGNYMRLLQSWPET